MAEISQALLDIKAHLINLNSKLNNHAIIKKDNDFVFITKMQSLYNLKFDSKLHSILYETLLKGAIESELISPGGFELFFELFTTNQFDDVNESSYNLTNPKIDDIDWLINKYLPKLNHNSLGAMILDSLKLAGFGGHIVIEKSKSPKPSIELVKGYVFNLSPAFRLPKAIKYDNSYVVCIDGYVESVSEIHHLLQQANESKSTIILFARGLADDVIQTLKINHVRGTLNVIPVIVPFDLEGVNQLVDIAIVCNTDVVSTIKGDLISSLQLENLSTVDSCMITTGKIIFQDRQSVKNVAIHLLNLRKKRETVIEDVALILDKRIKSLFSSQVIIRLLDDVDYVVNSQIIDYCLRAYSSLLRMGLTNFNGNKELTATVIGSTKTFISYRSQLLSLGAVVT